MCLLAGALFVAGCGSSGSNGAKAPSSQQAATQSGTAQSVAVGAQGVATPASLCRPEGLSKPKKQCAKGLKRLSKGKAKNPAAACKGLSKKKTKGVKGKSPYAVCVSAAAKLMASKNAASNGNGSADSNSSDNSSSSDSTDTTDTSSSDTSGDQLICTDAQGNNVSEDDPSVEDCEPAPGAGASANDNSGDSTDSTDTTDTTGDSSNSSDGTDTTDSGN